MGLIRAILVSHNAIGSALVRSQVLPYLRGLESMGHDVRLLTFERGERFPAGEYDPARWVGLRAGTGHSLPVKILDIARGCVALFLLTLRQRPALLHARSYVAAAICWLVGALTRRPYVFDMRGFLGEEFVDAGWWTRADLRFRALRLAEKRLLCDAGSIVVLTEAASRRLRSDPAYAPYVGDRPITVIPCAVDLDRFRPQPTRDRRPTLVYSGSLGMWYLLDEMLQVFAYAREHTSDLRFRILNRPEQGRIREAIERIGIDPSCVEISSADFADMPRALGDAHVAIALLRRVPSKIGSSPVKIAEYLACGLPTVVNRGLGDSDALIARYRAGHVVETLSSDDLRAAGAAVAQLVADEQARIDARRLAEEVYSVPSAVARYDAVYRATVGSPA